MSREIRTLFERAWQLADEATLEAYAHFTKDGTAEVQEVIAVHRGMMRAMLEELMAMEAKAA